MRTAARDSPPSLKVEGGRLDFESYVPQRRALRVIVEKPNVTISLKPSVPWIDPVFEFLKAPRQLSEIRLGERTIPPEDYAWDGQTLWLRARVREPLDLRLSFRD